MFQGIKVKLLKRGKIQKVRLLSLLQDFEDRLEALENANGSGEGSNDSSSTDSESGTTEPSVSPSSNVDVSFTVTNDDTPVNGATVLIAEHTNEHTIIGRGTTGSAGGCTIKNIPVNSYYLMAFINVDNGSYSCDPIEVEISKTNNSFELDLFSYSNTIFDSDGNPT